MTDDDAHHFCSTLLAAVNECRVRCDEVDGRVWGAINRQGAQALALVFATEVMGAIWIWDVALHIVDDNSAEPAASLLCLRPQAWGAPAGNVAFPK